jgi:hypothetical protein
MTANQTWFEGKKFGSCSLQNSLSINIHEIEYFSQLVNKSDVDIVANFRLLAASATFMEGAKSTCRNN